MARKIEARTNGRMKARETEMHREREREAFNPTAATDAWEPPSPSYSSASQAVGDMVTGEDAPTTAAAPEHFPPGEVAPATHNEEGGGEAEADGVPLPPDEGEL